MTGSLLAQAPPPAPIPHAPAKPIGAMSQPPPDSNKVVLTVGTETLTVGQYEQLVESLPEQYRASARGPGKRQMLEQLITLKAMAQEARKRKLDQDPGYQAQLAFQAENILAGILFRDLSANLKIEDADLHKAYDEHKSDYERVKARHILIRMKGSAVPLGKGKTELSDEEALAKANDLRAKILAGADFSTLAKAESDDAGSGANGGDLNFFSHGQMVAPFDKAAFALPVGQISEPVKSQFGYHLIIVDKHETRSFDDVKPELEKKLRPELAKKAVENVRKQTKVEVDDSFFGPAPSTAPAKPALTPAK
jgi:peptidyl-prolyl cis-trans isomerase C